MIQNTSETRESLMEYTIPQLEAMMEAIADSNKTEENPGTLTGKAAIEALRKL